MTQEQINAQAEFSPSIENAYNQKKRILDTIERQGWISKWGAIYDVRLHCSKLSTRIGEIEAACGHKFVRTRQYVVDGNKQRFVGMKYSLPEGLTINDFRKC